MFGRHFELVDMLEACVLVVVVIFSRGFGGDLAKMNVLVLEVEEVEERKDGDLFNSVSVQRIYFLELLDHLDVIFQLFIICVELRFDEFVLVLNGPFVNVYLA